MATATRDVTEITEKYKILIRKDDVGAELFTLQLAQRVITYIT